MLPEQWEIFKRAARLEKLDKIPMALIVDSPWIPGYLGIKHLDYYLDREVWFEANLKIMREFPDIIFIPSWWMEFGMAAEPSVLGAKIKFWQDNTPSEYHTLYRLEDIDQFPEYEVEADAFAALTLHRIGMERQRILDHGYILPMVTSRGPLCTAGFVRGTTEFMIDLVENPEGAHKLIDLCTRVVIDWLKAQHKAMGDTVEGIFILDDIVGFVNEDHYQEFAHPYLKRICDAFPADWVKLYHNDAEVDACLDHLPDAGFNMLNWGKQRDIREVKRRVGKRMCLMGNVNPLEIAVRGTPREVKRATLDVLDGAEGEGIVLSVGGGVSPGWESGFSIGVAVITLMMVFVIQHTQGREQIATQRKLDELLRALPEAESGLMMLEEASEDEMRDVEMGQRALKVSAIGGRPERPAEWTATFGGP